MRFFHISDNSELDEVLIEPRVPETIMRHENYWTPRICVSPSINGCLTALQRYKEGDVLCVYECFSKNYYQPTEEEVEDAPLTGEFWIVKPVVFRYFMTIRLTKEVATNLNQLSNNFYTFEVLSY